MINRLFIGLLIVSGLFLGGCRKSSDQDEQRYNWSSEAPLSIPFKTRIQRFEKGNLIRNHSFETGRTFTFDTSRAPFVIEGWQQIGQHVQWVDIRNDSLFDDNEAFSGHRSVKIVRKNAYETDEQGDGIMSEYIKVIPGNYILSFYTRLENIIPVKTRLGIRMYDAVNVRLLYYDRNKIEISDKCRFPQAGQYINTSFKSLSLANYSYIRSFGWGKIIGKSEHFPFPDGDIPTEAHYVRIYIGLKGKGTMWIDSVSLTYGSRNFSVYERMQAYIDTLFSPPEAIVPTPKSYRKLESVVFQSPQMEKEELPLILIPSHPDAMIKKAAGMLQNALQIPGERIVTDAGISALGKSVLVFSLGATPLNKQFQSHLPENDIRQHPQGYYIHSPAEMPNLVFLGGNSNDAVYYAVLTVLQMIEKKKPVYHNARIVDYPDFPGRFCALRIPPDGNNILNDELVEELTRYKLNGAFYEADTDRIFNVPQPPGELFRVSGIPRFPEPSGYASAYPPISGFPLQPVFHNQQLDYESLDNYVNTGSRISRNFYSGCSYFSVNTDDADIDRYVTVSRSRPVFMDNSMQMFMPSEFNPANDPWYPGKMRLYNIFEPFGNEAIREHLPALDTTTFFIRFAAGSEIEIIRLATAADFIWNTANYSKDRSLWKVLQSRYGAETGRKLILYADKYGHMLEILSRMKKTGQIPRNLKNEQQTLAALGTLVGEISAMLGAEHRLVKELRTLNSGLKDSLTNIAADERVVK